MQNGGQGGFVGGQRPGGNQGGFGGGQVPGGMTPPTDDGAEDFDGQMPEGMTPPDGFEMPEGMPPLMDLNCRIEWNCPKICKEICPVIWVAVE